jgi:hypothetical protein
MSRNDVMTKEKIALVTYKKQDKFSAGTQVDEDALLLDFLMQRGLDVSLQIWDDPCVNWQDYDLVVLKSTWDYHNKYGAFLLWLEQLQTWDIKVCNPTNIIKWNSHKRYLCEVQQKGLKVVPSAYPIDIVHIMDCYLKFETDEIVIKPCISAGAQDTIRIHKDVFEQHREKIENLLKTTDMIIQPYIREIEQGEWSFLFFGGKFSHSVLKTPKPNDFRVQHYHGGQISSRKVSEQLVRDQITPYVTNFATNCLFARVDGVFIDEIFHLMELELIEPYLFLDASEIALENYYRAIISVCKQSLFAAD